MPRRRFFARVALDVPLPVLYDYAVHAEVAPGAFVLVPFGRRICTGVVVEITESTEVPEARVKSIHSVRTDVPALSRAWVDYVRFLAAYYQRPLGEAIVASLPPRIRSARALPRNSARATPPSSQPTPWRFASMHEPSPAQRMAVDRVVSRLGSFAALLLHGVTGSGKTEVYLRAIAAVLERGGQALVLVPEIGLTPQLEQRFRRAFPDTPTAVLHSALEDVPRTSAWLSAARGHAAVVLGTRLAVLAPLERLALIVVDEEHDPSFKQQEGLRYSARDAAVYRAREAGCPVVLGSATPSLETWHNWRTGRYERIVLPERAVPGAKLPVVRTVDLRAERPRDGMTEPLKRAIAARLQRGEQSLLFLNRRGYAPVVTCEACGWSAGCRRCSTRMVMHAADRRLRCHHCGAEAPLPRACAVCGNADLKPLGRGTQRVEEALAQAFPAARTVRIDRDSMRRRSQLEATLAAVQRGEADILIGTQLLAKGHDFPALTLVGVLNADTALLSTDYRAPERLFALLAQVAGRAGRREQPGEVLVQTRYPDHPLFASLARHDFDGFADAQLDERRAAGFPPFVHEAAVRAEAARLADSLAFLREVQAQAAPPEVDVFDPVPHLITRRSGLERAQLVLQSRSRKALQAHLARVTAHLYAAPPRRVRWHIDVDPIEFD